jgi:hypothetical protein
VLQHLKDIWTKNWTSFWGWLKIATGSTVAVVPMVGHVLNEPRVQSSIDQLHLDPKIGLGLAALGVVTLLSVEHA